MPSIDVRGGFSSPRAYKGSAMESGMGPGLWEGRQFRAYRVFSAAQQLRFTCLKNFILQVQGMYVDDGQATVQILTGSTPSGTWTPITTQNPKNRLPSNVYVQQNIIEAGGTFTGGTERELLRADAGSGSGVGFSSNLGSPRLLPAGTYYFNLSVTGTTAGIYSLEWEEMD